MPEVSKLVTVVSRAVASLSTKLSIAAVLGIMLIPVVPEVASSKIDSRNPTPTDQPATDARAAPAPPIDVVRSKPMPIGAPSLQEPAEDPTYADSPFQVAARRSRGRREAAEPAVKIERTPSAIAIVKPPPPAAEPDSEAEPPRSRRERRNRAEAPRGPKREASAIAAPAPSVPVQPTTPETAAAEPPKPDVWPDSDVIAALRDCVRLLGPVAAEVEVAPPVKHEQCGAPAPVLLKRIGSGANRVEINPPAMVNCAMVAGLHNWVEKTLQPAARETLGSNIVRLRSASGYNCRNRNGTLKHADRLSEHALANAVDIAGFVTADGRTIDVAHFWGPTARDQREAERIAAAQAREAKKTGSAPTPKIDPQRRRSAIAEKASERTRGDKGKSPVRTSELQRLGRGTIDQAIPAPPTGPAGAAEKSTEGAFLHRLHKGACGVFGTVLGPEANEAHRDHFHFDMAARKRSSFCE